MEIRIGKDKKGEHIIEWEQVPDGWKLAWIQHKTNPDKDWASTPSGRYLNVVRTDGPGCGPAGNATDFPIFSNLPDKAILLSFVVAVNGITGLLSETITEND